MDRFELLVYAVLAIVSALTITGAIAYMIAARLDKKRGDD